MNNVAFNSAHISERHSHFIGRVVTDRPDEVEEGVNGENSSILVARSELAFD